jgi:exosome complex component RRP4
MVSMIKQATKCDIAVGQNGIVWLSGEPEGEVIATQAIRIIQEEAHLGGLTNRIASWLSEKTGMIVTPAASPEPEGGSP